MEKCTAGCANLLITKIVASSKLSINPLVYLAFLHEFVADAAGDAAIVFTGSKTKS